MPKPRSLTDVQVKEMGELYAAGFNQVQLAEHFGTNDSVVRKWLKKSGVVTHYNVKLTGDKILDACVLYDEGVSTLSIGKHFGLSPQTIANALQAKGIELRAAGGFRHLVLNEAAFDILTPESLYWLAILATDGCVTGTGSRIDEVKLALKAADCAHVAAFRAFLGSEHKLQFYLTQDPEDETVWHEMCRFAVRSLHLAAELAKYGVVPRKTYTLVMRGGVENSRDLWRGAVDGDGHVGVHRSNQGPDVCLKLSGVSKPFIDQFYAFLRANGVASEQGVCEVTREGSLGKVPKFECRVAGRAALDTIALLYVDGGSMLARKAHDAAVALLRGSRGELVGTIRDPWRNDSAVRWAHEFLDRSAPSAQAA